MRSMNKSSMRRRHPSPEMLTDYVLGFLPPRAAERLKGHLEGCPDCRAEAARWRALLARVERGRPREAPSRSVRQVAARLWVALQPAPRPPLAEILAFTLALVACGLGLAWLLSPGSTDLVLPGLPPGLGRLPGWWAGAFLGVATLGAVCALPLLRGQGEFVEFASKRVGEG
ncbi:MAG: zf-HC2 domain-containing protein [Clostridia bacterium]|nr:zf-HC2 domain-containing protein [Clostridia bacterium]